MMAHGAKGESGLTLRGKLCHDRKWLVWLWRGPSMAIVRSEWQWTRDWGREHKAERVCASNSEGGAGPNEWYLPPARHSRAELGSPAGQMGNSHSGGGWEPAVKGKCAQGSEPPPSTYSNRQQFWLPITVKTPTWTCWGKRSLLSAPRWHGLAPRHRPQAWR